MKDLQANESRVTYVNDLAHQLGDEGHPDIELITAKQTVRVTFLQMVTENFTPLFISDLNELFMTSFKCFHVLGSEWGLGKIENAGNNASKTTSWSTADSQLLSVSFL